MTLRIATNLSLPADLVKEIDLVAGKRNRSAFVEDAVRRHLQRDHLRASIDHTAGAWHGRGLAEWSEPGGVLAWVRASRAEETSTGDPG